MFKARRLSVPTAFVAAACSGNSPTSDAGHDAGYDAGIDSGVDAGTDAGTDGGVDGGPDAGPSPADAGVCDDLSMLGIVKTDDAGVRCACEVNFADPQSDGGYPAYLECDYDVGNPCRFGCFNATDPDGGRIYEADGGPLCFC